MGTGQGMGNSGRGLLWGCIDLQFPTVWVFREPGACKQKQAGVQGWLHPGQLVKPAPLHVSKRSGMSHTQLVPSRHSMCGSHHCERRVVTCDTGCF
jgi:hypothetical protein